MLTDLPAALIVPHIYHGIPSRRCKYATRTRIETILFRYERVKCFRDRDDRGSRYAGLRVPPPTARVKSRRCSANFPLFATVDERISLLLEASRVVRIRRREVLSSSDLDLAG